MRPGGVGRDIRRADTRPGVERTIVWGFVAIRGFDLLQAVVAMATGALRVSTNAALNAAVFAIVVVESLLLSRWLVRRRSVLPLQWPVGADVGLAALALASAVLTVPPEARIGVWAMWSYAVTLSTSVLIGGVLPNWRHVLAVSGLLAVIYVAVVALPLSGNPVGQATAIANALAYPGFALVSFMFIRFVRQLADTADTARARVAELERDRSRAVVHDLLPYLRLDRFAEADDSTRLALAEQARQAYDRMRSFVDGTDDMLDLETRVRAVLALHQALGVRAVIDLESGIKLPDEVLDHLHRALDTALTNVEQHAPGSAVVVSARSESNHVEIVVHDDGPGFDPALTPPGFGIAETLGRQLAAVGGASTVQSTPGHGTEVTITVPRDAR